MIRLLLLAFLVGSALAKIDRFHVIKTDPTSNKGDNVPTFEEIRKAVMEQEAQEELNAEEIKADEEVILISPDEIIKLFLRNPGNELEEIFIRDFLPVNSIIVDFHLRNRGFLFQSEQKESLSEVEQHFLGAEEEGRSTAILGRIHKSSTYDNIKWLSDEELKAYDEDDKSIQDFQWFQETGILVRVMPGEVFSIRLVFREEVTGIAVSEFKELFKTHITAHMAPKGVGLQGFIESPNYAFNQYSNNADMKWLVRLPPNRDFGIQLQITELETESCCDRITIFDGPTMKSPVIGLLSGSLDNNTVVNYTTAGPDALLEFRSDCSVDNGYFSFTFNSIKFPLLPACNGQDFLEGTEGFITSANYPLDYPEMANCDWIIVTPRRTTVTLEIIDFQLDDRDTVTVLDVYTTGSEILALLSGEVAAHTIINGHTNSMELYFSSETHILKRRGFNFYYTATRVPQPCVEGVVIQDVQTGEIMSQNYPQNYDAGSTCTWQIRMPEGYVVQFNVDDFSTEATFDFLNIYDGPDDSSRLMASLSGSTAQEGILVTSDSLAFLKFMSDQSVNDKGFHLTFQQITKSTICNATQTVTGSVGFISTPNYPNPFPSFSRCSWLIQTDMNTVASVILIDLNLGINANNSLQIYDGSSTSNRLLYSGSMLRNPQTVNATQNKVYVSLNTRDNFEFRGFLLQYKQIDVVSYCSSTQVIFAPEGEITSPLYPGFYPSGYSCSWLIQTPLLSSVSLQSKLFQLSPLDTLTAYDGTDDKSPMLFTCTGTVCPVIPATGPNMFLVLNTKSTNAGFRFQFYATSSTCSGSKHIFGTATSGYITSPMFPYDYPSTSCEWSVTGTPFEIVEINIQSSYTEACCDWLRIYDGNSRDSPLLINWSGLHGATTIKTTGNHALIAFDVDQSVTAQGFNLYYNTYHPKTPDVGSGEEQYFCSAYDDIDQQQIQYGRGYITSPNYANGYTNNLDYCWYIALYPIYRQTKLTFLRIETEEGFDLIEVFYGETTDPDYKRVELSGHIYQYEVILESFLSTILFHTDNTMTDKGFVMEFEGIK